jgi:hypothetical protein
MKDGMTRESWRKAGGACRIGMEKLVSTSLRGLTLDRGKDNHGVSGGGFGKVKK